jgi:hypothetical protein
MCEFIKGVFPRSIFLIWGDAPLSAALLHGLPFGFGSAS